LDWTTWATTGKLSEFNRTERFGSVDIEPFSIHIKLYRTTRFDFINEKFADADMVKEL